MGNKSCKSKLIIYSKFISGDLADKAALTQTFNSLKDVDNEVLFVKAKMGQYKFFAFGGIYRDHLFNSFSANGISIYVFGNPIDESIGILLRGRRINTLIKYKGVTVSRAVNSAIYREIGANNVLAEFECIKDSYIYELCRAALLQGLVIIDKDYSLSSKEILQKEGKNYSPSKRSDTIPCNYRNDELPHMRIIKDFNNECSVVLGFSHSTVITGAFMVGDQARITTILDGYTLISDSEYSNLIENNEGSLSSKGYDPIPIQLDWTIGYNNWMKILVTFILRKIINREYRKEIPRIYEGIAISTVKRANNPC